MVSKILLLADASNVHTNKWACFFRDNNFHVEILSLLPAKISGVKVHILHSKAYNNRKNTLEYNRVKTLFEVIPQIRKLIKVIKPDILHAHFVSSFGLFGALSGFHPYAISSWGYDTITFPDKNIIYGNIVRFALSKADIIFATSKFLAQKTARFTKKNIIITPFGVNINKFSPLTNNKKTDKFIFGTIKALYPKYGIRYLIEAAKIIDKQISDWELWIAGSGTEEEFLKKLTKKMSIEKKVKFLGRIPHKNVPCTLREMDIFIMPSVWECESFGVAVVEAASCSIPVIASKIGGLPEVVEDGKTGFLVTPRKAVEIADKILFLYQNLKIRKEMAKAAREFILKNYCWQDNAKIMLDVYKEKL